MKHQTFKRLLAAIAIVAGLTPGLVLGEEIFLGFDILGPVQRYTTSGTFLGNFGQEDATGSALGAGAAWTVAPAFGSNTIKKYDVAQNELNSFTATVGGQWIEDMAYAGKVAGVDTLWASTFEGDVFRLDANTGAVISSFSPGLGQFLGVAYDGTDLWLTGGAFQGNTKISHYTTTGSFLGSIETGLTGAGGVGYSADTGTLWVGYFGTVRQFDLSGAELSSFVAGSAFHDGLEIGIVPEPATVLLMGLGLAGLAVMRLRKG